MKPFFMRLTQGKEHLQRDIWVNMNQVCHITTDGMTGSVLTFAASVGTDNEPAYICANESPESIGNRSEWRA